MKRLLHLRPASGVQSEAELLEEDLWTKLFGPVGHYGYKSHSEFRGSEGFAHMRVQMQGSTFIVCANVVDALLAIRECDSAWTLGNSDILYGVKASCS